MLARDLVHREPRKRKSVALVTVTVAWGDDGGGAFCVAGTLVAVEVTAGGGGLRMELAREGGGRSRRSAAWLGRPRGAPSPCSGAPSSLTDSALVAGKVCDGPAEGAGADATANVRR